MAAGMRFDKSELDSLKQANPIEEVARELGLNVIAHKMRCPNPEKHSHGDRSPSVTFWPEKGSFRCWVCPEIKGDVIDLVRMTKGMSFGETVRWLRARRGLDPADPFSSSPVWTRTTSARAHTSPAFIPAGAKTSDVTPGSLPAAASENLKSEILSYLLRIAAPVSGPAARYLQSRRIFKKTWDAQRLKWVDDYGRIARELSDHFGRQVLIDQGFFNAEGHFRYYRHILLFPYFDEEGKPVYLQARAVQEGVIPKELSLSGSIPLPYNIAALKDSKPYVYLCEGVVDTLTLLEQGFPALGVPGASNFKPAWASLFQGKSVFIVFDPDAAGEAGAHRVEALLGEIGVIAHRQAMPFGKDINAWFRKGGMPEGDPGLKR